MSEPQMLLFDAHDAPRDPTQTTMLRKAFRAAAKLQLRQLRAAMRVAVTDHNVLGFGSAQGAQPTSTRLIAFSSWLDSTGRQYLLGPDWARTYIQRAWRMGARRAAQETTAPIGEDHSDRIIALADIEIEGILNATVQQVSRTAAQIIARGTRRYQALRQLYRTFDKIAQPRLVVMADVLAVKAYNEAKLRTYQEAGITHVGLHVETLPHVSTTRMDAADRKRALTAKEKLSAPSRARLQREYEEELVGVLTAGDNKVCEACQDFADDAPYEIDEVLDVLPMHPRCRCAVFPWEDLRYRGEDEAAFDPAEHPRGFHGWWSEKGMIASRRITAKRVKGAEGYVKKFTRPDVAAMRENPIAFKHDVLLFSNENAYPNFRTGELHGDADDRAATIVDHLKQNIRFVYDHAPESMKASGMRWYRQAHDIAVADGAKYGIDERAAAGVIATLSPQKDWDQNIYLAHAVLEINSKQQDHLWDDEMATTATRIWKAKDRELVEAVQNKKLSELSDPVEKAVWIRTYDEAHSDRSYKSFDTGEVVTTAAGKPAKAAWQAVAAIANAVQSMDSKGDLTVISDALGEKHKVRSFYNNIIAPDAPNGDVTVDTHAVGVGLLRSLSGKAAAVMHCLGTSPQGDKPPGWSAASKSAITGLSGTYALYADAYRAVAKDLGILPQQVQAITWQAKRALFDISDKKKIAVETEWQHYHDGLHTLEETQQNVLRIARG